MSGSLNEGGVIVSRKKSVSVAGSSSVNPREALFDGFTDEAARSSVKAIAINWRFHATGVSCKLYQRSSR